MGKVSFSADHAVSKGQNLIQAKGWRAIPSASDATGIAWTRSSFRDKYHGQQAKPRPARSADKLKCQKLSTAFVFEDLEHVVDEGFAFVGREVAGMDGLLVGLEVSQGSFFGQVLVYKADDGVDLLAG